MKGKKGQRSLFNGKLLFLFSFVLLMIGGVWNARTASAALPSPNPLEAKAQLTQPLSATALGDTTNILPQPRAITYKYSGIWLVAKPGYKDPLGNTSYDYQLRPSTGPWPAFVVYASGNDGAISPALSTTSRTPLSPLKVYTEATAAVGGYTTNAAYGNTKAYYTNPEKDFAGMVYGSIGSQEGDSYVNSSSLMKPGYQLPTYYPSYKLIYSYYTQLRLKADPVQHTYPVGAQQPSSVNDWITNIRWLEDDGTTWTPVTSGYTVTLRTSYKTWDSSKEGKVTYQVVLSYNGAQVYIPVDVTYVNKPSSTITFNFVDENGKQIRDPETKTGIEGANWSLPAPAIDGYKFDRSSSGAQSGAFGATDQTIWYYYKKDQPAKEPLKVVFVKYNDPNYTDDGPNYLSYRLPGAQMEFQSLKSNGTWQKFNVANDKTNYTTNQYGEIVLSQAVIDAIEDYGGKPNDQKFRFVEKEAPNGYVQPNGSSNPGAAFTSEEKVLTKDTAGQQVFRLVNTKEAAAGGTVTVNYYEKGTTTKLATSVTLNGKVGETWQATRDTTITTGGVTYTLDGTATLDGKNEGSTPALQGTFNANQRTVNYYYNAPATPTAAPINVYYYIQGTTTSVNDMISFVPLKPIGDFVEAEAKTSYTYQDDTYKLVSYKVDNGIVTSTSNPIKVEVKSTAQTVVYYYEKQEVGTVNSIKVIKYDDSTPRKPLKGAKFSLQWRSSGSSLWTGIGLGFESDENGVAEVPAEYVQSVNTLEGQWKIVETDPPTGFEKVGNGETEIFTRNSGTDLQFEMVNKRKDGGKVTVNYFIENTETPLVTSKTLTGKYEEEWTAARETVITKDGIEYTLKSAVFNNNPVDDVNTPVSGKFTLNAQTVTYYYESEDLGDITWKVPPTMDFGEVNTPVRQAQNIFLQAQPDQKNWQISVNDARQKNRNQWNITAQLTEPFTNKKGQKLANDILKFKSTASGTAQDLSQATQIYQSEANPALGDTPITWNSTSGFYLDLISNGYYPVGEYQGTVTFTLSTTP